MMPGQSLPCGTCLRWKFFSCHNAYEVFAKDFVLLFYKLILTFLKRLEDKVTYQWKPSMWLTFFSFRSIAILHSAHLMGFAKRLLLCNHWIKLNVGPCSKGTKWLKFMLLVLKRKLSWTKSKKAFCWQHCYSVLIGGGGFGIKNLLF